MRILKFGGKSLESFEKVQKICEYIKKSYKKEKKLIVVVSAFGNTTNILQTQANEYGGKNLDQRELAILLSTGETQSASLVCMHLQKIGIPAKSFSGRDISLTTFGEMTNGKIGFISKKKIDECLKRNTVAVVCGFQGINFSGETTTLGRGGSDTTATALGVVFDVPVEIFSDYEGIFSGDPRLLPFKKIKQINYSSMLSMSKAGAKVLDEHALSIAEKHGVKIYSKCSSSPEADGSEIVSIEKDAVAISCINKLSKVTITFSDSLKLKKITSVVLEEISKVKFYNLSLKQNNISFFVFEKDFNLVFYNISKKLNLIDN